MQEDHSKLTSSSNVPDLVNINYVRNVPLHSTTSLLCELEQGNISEPQYLVCKMGFITIIPCRVVVRMKWDNFIYLFIYWGEGEGEKHWYVRDTSIGCLLSSPNWGPSLEIQASALTENWTNNPSVCRLALNPLRCTSQGKKWEFSIERRPGKYECLVNDSYQKWL